MTERSAFFYFVGNFYFILLLLSFSCAREVEKGGADIKRDISIETLVLFIGGEGLKRNDIRRHKDGC